MASHELCRPDPDELLRRIQAQEEISRRGRLKIFLGYAPRVGKSLRMFDEGRRRKKRGQDVVVGIVQSRGSEDVRQMLGEFEVIPPLRVGDAETLDVAAVLKRAPQFCLVDEIAKDNPPGSRHAHRWEDVEELRASGVNVVGAVNLQYICEQQNAVEQITGRRSPNSIPQNFIESADEIVIVDVPTENVVQSGNPRQGASNPLSPSQLSELRELALLLAAQVVERQLQTYMDAHHIQQSWGTQERILVCLTPRSRARDMLESGARAASRFHGQLLVIHVRQENLTREAEETVKDNLEFAAKLGAEVHIVESAVEKQDPIDAILRFATEQRVTQVFIGHTRQSAWKIWEKNPVDRLISEAEGMDVRIFPHDEPSA